LSPRHVRLRETFDCERRSLYDAQDELLRFNRLRAQGLGQFGQYYGGGTAKAAWAPALDITERKDAYLVTVELPGVGIDDLEITFQDGLLTIQGERHDAHHSSEEMVHRVERRYGRFLRSITLPTHVMADAIEASTQDGVLQILVPKAPEVQAKPGTRQPQTRQPGTSHRGRNQQLTTRPPRELTSPAATAGLSRGSGRRTPKRPQQGTAPGCAGQQQPLCAASHIAQLGIDGCEHLHPRAVAAGRHVGPGRPRRYLRGGVGRCPQPVSIGRA